MASIRTDRRPEPCRQAIQGKGERFRIVSGERRYRALKLLAEQGDLAED